MVSPNLEAALSYAEKGWRVFPLHHILPSGACSCGTKCNDPGKHPRVAWKDAATTDSDEIHYWWDVWPDANIGIATGKLSGLWVLDLDNKQSVDIGDGLLIGLGTHSLRALENQYDDLPETLVQVTGSGGNHFFFTYPSTGEYRNRTGLVPGVDVRAEGGYVVGPPSNHVSGNTYQWVDPDENLADVPEWLRELSLKSRSPRPLEEGETVSEGGRNDYLYRMGAKLRGEKDLNFIELLGALGAYNAEYCDPPLDEDEVYRIAKNVDQLPPNEPDPIVMIPSGRLVAGDPNAEMHAGDDLALSLGELLTKDLQPPKPLVAGLIDAGTGVLLAGEPNVGKTWLAMDLALAVATGSNYLDRPTEQAPVLYIDEEGSEWGDQQRFMMMVNGRNLGSAIDLPLHLAIGKQFKLDTPRGLTAVRRMIERYRPQLIIIDSLVRVQTGDENSSRDMEKFFSIAKRIQGTTGAALLFIHHVRKSSKDDDGTNLMQLIRGSSEIPAYFDTILIAKANEAGVEVHVNKQRWRKKATPALYKIVVEEEQLARVEFVTELDEPSGERDTAGTRLFIARKVHELIDSGELATVQSVAGATNRSVTSVRSHLEAMSAPGGVLEKYAAKIEFDGKTKSTIAFRPLMRKRSGDNQSVPMNQGQLPSTE
jgi:hypothetical protein